MAIEAVAVACKACISTIVSKVTEALVTPILSEVSYGFQYQSNMAKLRSQIDNLEVKRRRLEQTVKDAKRQGDEIHDDVQRCLDQMIELTARAEKLIEEDKRSFTGLCPDFMTRHKLSKEAVNAEKDAKDLLKKANFSDVSYRPAPQRTEFINAFRAYQQFDSRMKVFQDVMDALTNSNVNMIGVYGMGGVGKTMLVKLVAEKVIENELFDEVVMVEVTQNQDYNILRDKIARDLGIKFDQNESVYDRANRLSQILNMEKRFLVILDNIWAELNLEALGIPFRGEDQGRCKILLTSRNLHVLCNVMNSQRNFLIEVLSDEEAMSLFWKTMGDHPNETSNFQPLAVEIVGKCGGLPIAIKTIAKALKNKGPHLWKDALNLLEKPNSRRIQGLVADLYSTIELSYNLLENKEAKSLFLHCGLLNDGSQIPINYLLWCGMGLGLFCLQMSKHWKKEGIGCFR